MATVLQLEAEAPAFHIFPISTNPELLGQTPQAEDISSSNCSGVAQSGLVPTVTEQPG